MAMNTPKWNILLFYAISIIIIEYNKRTINLYL